MTYGELVWRLRQRGIVDTGEGKRHEKWVDPATGKWAMLPRHRKEIPTGTLQAILRQPGLTLDDLLTG